MKRILFHGVILFFAMSLLAACGSTRTAAEKEKMSADISRAVGEGDFIFKATYAYPTGYRSIYLSPYYEVRVVPDTVTAYLPYYGRAYSAPINPSEGGYRFTSTNFEYQTSPGKRKGNWEAVITIRDVDRPVTFRFDIWENGKGRLDVTDVNRQPISFQGDIVIKAEEQVE